ncbi:MAG: STAS domain-containing protein [Thermoproteota archaeon]|nr:STAS domain-containing protein [Thermoproteota archaeon]
MKVKIDTKEKFHVITPQDAFLTANMTEDMIQKLLSYIINDTKNVILNLKMVEGIDQSIAKSLIKLQTNFYEKNASFVICEMQQIVLDTFEELEVIDQINYTLTESEAWDIVQMEEIEREYLD